LIFVDLGAAAALTWTELLNREINRFPFLINASFSGVKSLYKIEVLFCLRAEPRENINPSVLKAA
jgi:hypothetical protein